LKTLWIKIIRYSNDDINYHLEGVMLDLEDKLRQRKLELEKNK
jgi:hypothetical protein